MVSLTIQQYFNSFLLTLNINVDFTQIKDKNEHAFCQTCIHKWLEKSGECPVDRTPLSRVDLKPVSRLLQNLLSE